MSSPKESESNAESERVRMDCDSPIFEFDALPRDAVLELLVLCIAQLSPKQKSVLALYYHEDLEPIEIAACLGLTECEIDQVRTEAVGLLQSMLAAKIRLTELPASFDKPDADGVGLLVDR